MHACGKSFLQLCVLLAQILCQVHGDKKTEAVKAIQQLQEQFWQWRLRENPLMATQCGVNTYDDRLEAYNETAFSQRKLVAEHLLRSVSRIDTSVLDNENKASVDILRTLLQTFINGYKYRRHSAYNDMSPMDNPLIAVRAIMGFARRNTVQDYDNLIARCNALDTAMNDKISLMKIAITEGLTLHNCSLTGIVEKLQSLEVDPRQSEFYLPFENISAAINISERTRLTKAGLDAVENRVLPAFKRFKEFLINEYIPNTRPRIGASSLPNGTEFYKSCLQFHLSLDISPDEIHQTGQREVARIKGEMEKIKEKDEFVGDLKSYIAYLKNKTEFYKTEEGMLTGYRKMIEKVKTKIGVMFKKQPKMDVGVKKQGNIHSSSGYSVPSLDGSKKGYFVANVYQPWTRPPFNMMALTLHEAIPGHHTQIAYSLEEDLPYFRRAIGYTHMSAVPFAWAIFTAYVEGWALYAESLGEEVGLYDDPYSLFGRYSSEIFRAARLVVDTGLHAKGWSRQQAVDYLYEHSTNSMFLTENEINRYISWPGQACAYKIGELKIRELRKRATEALGSRFDIREFHDQILKLGASPLNVLEENINVWIKSYTSAAASLYTCALTSLCTLIVLFI